MKLRISEKMDGYFENDIRLEHTDVVSVDNVRNRTMEKLGLSQPRDVRPARKIGRVLLIAAAVVAMLSAAAVAVYRYSVQDTVIEDMPDFTDVTQVRDERSLNGFADSPEYQAYVEWESWDRVWRSENQDWFQEHGVDDTYSEVDEAYAGQYGIYAREQADKFEEIMAKYGLTPHTAREGFETEAQLCAALGVEDFFGERFNIRGDYLFEDGAFKAVGTFLMDGEEVWVSMINAVKGSITMISSGISAEYEEWTYVTDSGIEVILASSEGSAWMVVDLEETYVTVTFSAPLAKAQVEDLVDDIDLSVLAERFDGSVSREESAAMLTAWKEARQNATSSDNADDDAALALSILGNYYLADVPEDAYIYRTGCNIPYTWGEISEEFFSITHWYQYKNGEITLSFYTLDDRGMDLDAYVGDHLETVTACTVNGYEGRVIALNDGENCAVYWLDTDRELWFRVGTPYTLDEAIALAESVTAEDPGLDASGPEGRQMRIALHEAEIREVQNRIIEGFEANEAAAREAMEAALEELGDYDVTQVPDGYKYVEHWQNEVLMQLGVGVQGQWNQINVQYRSDTGKALIFRYSRVVDEKDDAVSLNREHFEALKGYDGPVTECTVNGCEAIFRGEGTGVTELYWLDEEADVVFLVESIGAPDYIGMESLFSGEIETLSAEDLIAIAESVVKK